MENIKKGTLIVIEGIDGSGKQTQSNLLYESLINDKKNTVKITFPDYESKSSSLVKMYLNGEIGASNTVNVYAASSFYSADRYISYKNKWSKNYENGDIIISDRYTTSNIVHQMVRLEQSCWREYLNWLEDFEYTKMGLPKPDVVIYLDMPPEITQKLISKRYNGDNSKKDILEADFEYMQKCRKSALYAAQKLGWIILPCFSGETPLSPQEIHNKIMLELNNKI